MLPTRRRHKPPHVFMNLSTSQQHCGGKKYKKTESELGLFNEADDHLPRWGRSSERPRHMKLNAIIRVHFISFPCGFFNDSTSGSSSDSLYFPSRLSKNERRSMFISLQMKGNLSNLQQLREINATASCLAPAVSPRASTAPVPASHLSLPPPSLPPHSHQPR